MPDDDHIRFGRWLFNELVDEAVQSDRTNGRLPARPVCLSEVEAVGLMILALEGQQPILSSDLAVGTARHLADVLRVRLSQVHSELYGDPNATTIGERPGP